MCGVVWCGAIVVTHHRVRLNDATDSSHSGQTTLSSAVIELHIIFILSNRIKYFCALYHISHHINLLLLPILLRDVMSCSSYITYEVSLCLIISHRVHALDSRTWRHTHS